MPEPSYQLKRELSLFDVTVAGVGIILGAGIYALIGVAAGDGGNAMWLSFLLGAFVAGLTAFSYAELSSFFKGDSGEYEYCRHAFGGRIAWLVGMLTVFVGVVSAATVALGFAGYFSALVPVDYMLSAIFIVLLMSLINFFGIKMSSRFNAIATAAEFVGLLIIIVLGIPHWGSVDLLEMPHGITGVLQAGALVFFAYMGFESMVKLREETKNPDRTIPLALLLAVGITAVVYVLVSISAVSLLPYKDMSLSVSPLADAAAVSLGPFAFTLLAVIALFSTSNTVLLTLVTSSRMMYGMAQESSLPKFLRAVHPKQRTPHIAVIAAMLLAFALVLTGNIALVANLANVALFVTFVLVNVAAIILRYVIKKKRPFTMPLNIGRFPVLALLGAVSSCGLLVFAVMNLMIL